MPSRIIQKCGSLLKEKGFTIAFAESATAGRLAHEFSLTSVSGDVLKGGLVCYDAQVKEDVLGISPEFIEQYTPESAEVTRELAIRLARLIQSDVQVAVTGLTTPGGSETPDKPVGTIFLHIVVAGRHLALRKVFDGSPEQIVLMTADLAAQVIVEELQGF
ncbi:nicotinamide-nucleotide amidase [Dyadobacter sp. SG02]|uniref:CinA family protein n=1 Tax=Dyadobacter sp. SG02 TaxID=1855291 RepID=UPI0008BDF8B3|nr:CinA family protein [Dyadobacter sp. SG02]SEI51658.1 nicotinamide-nucleotide amidase [Dyadobacter sp. SG02]